MGRISVSTAISFFFLSGVAFSQTTVFEDSFDGGNIGQWALDPDPQTSPSTTSWNMDGNPTSIPLIGGAGASYNSPPNSLNYNSDTIPYDYNIDNTGTAFPTGSGGSGNSGSAISPAIDISSLTSPKLKFYCNYETQASSQDWRGLLVFDSAVVDQVIIQYHPDGVTTTNWSLTGTNATLQLETCPASGGWHTHEVDLDPAWGSINLVYQFDTYDTTDNKFAGWFIDDVKVSGDSGGTGGGGGGGGSVGDSTLYNPHAGGRDSDGRWYQENSGCSGKLVLLSMDRDRAGLIPLGIFFASLVLVVVSFRRFKI